MSKYEIYCKACNNPNVENKFTRPWLVDFNNFWADGIVMPEDTDSVDSLLTYSNSLVLNTKEDAEKIIDWFTRYVNSSGNMLTESLIIREHYGNPANYSVTEVGKDLTYRLLHNVHS